MVYSGLAVVSVFLLVYYSVATATHFGSVIKRTLSVIILRAKQLVLVAAFSV